MNTRFATQNAKGLNAADAGPYASTSSASASSPSSLATSSSEEICVICLCPMTNPKKLPCDHKFCTDCIDQSFHKCNPRCPSCGRLYGIERGSQPEGGTMTHHVIPSPLPGYPPGCATIVIEYTIPNGIQTNAHPHPGRWFTGTQREAYLPATAEGYDVLKLLEKAFKAGLVFTVGQSATTGIDNTVVWNDIHHKTSFTGPYGYPDPSYLTRIKSELAAKGII